MISMNVHEYMGIINMVNIDYDTRTHISSR
jgi:hypothetical protein